jgi:pimeloyl-ACP methyl ester carboxylesterase
MTVSSKDAVTKTVNVGGSPFAYREVGPTAGVPLVFLHHLTAVLDEWDPAVVDGLAAERRVILFVQQVRSFLRDWQGDAHH